MKNVISTAAAGVILAASGCSMDGGAEAPPPAASTAGPSVVASVAPGEYRTNQPGGCAYMTISGGEPVLYRWDEDCDGGFDFTSRPPTLRAEGDRIYVGRRETSHYGDIRPSGDGFAATQEFRGRRFEVQFSPS